MNTSAVQKEIWSELGPILRENGFRLEGNTARRFLSTHIDVIGLQWFGPSLAKRVRCTQNSFSVRLGCYFRFIPSLALLKTTDGEPLPEEAHCQIRKTVFRSFKQPECDRKDIWYVDTTGNSLDEIISRLKNAFEQEALPWFQRFSSLKEALRTIREDAEDDAKAYGFGKANSPMRQLYAGFIALRLGDNKSATADLRKALEARCFGALEPKIEAAINLAG